MCTAGESGWQKALVSVKPLRINTYALDKDCWGYFPTVTTQTTTGNGAWNQDMFNSCQRQRGTLAVHLYQWNSQYLLECVYMFVYVCECVCFFVCLLGCLTVFGSDLCFDEWECLWESDTERIDVQSPGSAAVPVWGNIFSPLPCL